MLQAFIKLGWICALLFGLPQLSTIHPCADPPALSLTVERSSGGAVFYQDSAGKMQEAITDQTITESIDLPLHLEAKADPGYRIASLETDGTLCKEAAMKKSYQWDLTDEGDHFIEAAFEKVPPEDVLLIPAPELAQSLSMDQDSWNEMLFDYASGNSEPWKSLRMQAGALLGVQDWLDEEGFVQADFFQTHSLRAFEEQGGAICNRMWLHAPQAGRISSPMSAGSAMKRSRALGLTVASRQFYTNTLMPGGNYMSNEYWTLSNGEKAYCANYIMASPVPGQAVEDPIEVDSAALRKSLYYGYGGPDNRLAQKGFVSTAQQIVATNDLVSMAYTGGCIAKNEAGGSNWYASVQALWNFVQSLPDPSGYKAYICNVPGTGVNHHSQKTGYQPLAYGKIAQKGALQLVKTSAVPGVSQAGSVNYSLEGAKYSLRKGSSFDAGTEIAVLITDAAGRSQAVELDAGQYWLKEIEAPAGYVKNPQPFSVQVTPGTTVSAPTRITAGEQPQYGKTEIALSKINTRTGQGERALRGAKFRMNYYNLNPSQTDRIEEAQPTRSWIMQTDDKGHIRMGDSYRVSGDDYYRNEKNEPVFPLGIVTFQEIEAPSGYEKNEELFIMPITPNPSKDEQLSILNTPVVPEKPFGLVVLKMDAGYNHYLPGARFRLLGPDLRSKVYETDENGKIALEFDATGNYMIEEISAPPGFQVNEKAVTITVEADSISCNAPTVGSSVTFYNSTLLYLDKPEDNRLKIIKTDENGQPLPGAQFALYEDEELKSRYARLTTDENGLAVFENVPEGSYWLKETQVPEGYRPNLDENGQPRICKIDVSIDLSSGKYEYKIDGQPVSEQAAGGWRVTENEGISCLEMRIENRRGYGAQLPQTGSFGASACLLAGSTLAACGLKSLRRKRKF